ncbi:MAG: ion transporter [Bacteroidota bacterium]
MLQEKSYRLSQSKPFQYAVVWAIIFCSILLGVETFFHERITIFKVLDIFFTFFFLLEIIIRMLAAGSLLSFFQLCTFNRQTKSTGNRLKIHWDETGFWNWFDTIIVFFSVISLIGHLVEHPEFLIVSRLFRVMRVLRLLEVSDELKSVEKQIISIIPTVFSFGLLLAVLLYIYSIVGTYLFGHKAFEKADFTDLPSAFLTLFQIMTLDNWSDIMDTTKGEVFGSWFYKGFFISFVILTAIISFNVFVAVLTTQVQRKILEEKKEVNQSLADQIEEDIEESEAELQKTLAELIAEVRELRTEVKSLKKVQ